MASHPSPDDLEPLLPPPPSLALTDPVAPAEQTWVTWLSLATIGVWAGFLGPIQVLLALQAEELSPDHKELVFGVVTALGAGVQVVAAPLFGAWSDRTTARWGRRLPWVLAGSAVSVFAFAVLAWAPNVLWMAVGWCLAQAGLNAMLAALTAAVPDRVPVAQRGTVGGWLGLSQTVGLVGGAGVATATGGVAAGYAATAALVVVLALPYLRDSRDRAITTADVPKLSRTELVRGFWISPRQHPDFAWAWLTRFLVNLGNFLGTLYLLFFLDDAVGYDDPEAGVLILSAIYAVVLIITTVLGGIWSDRIGRRKPLVIASGLVTGLAALTLAIVPTWPGAIAGAVILGAGFGVYLSVDFALVTEVLPAASDRARDLGVINIAVALPQVVAPLMATVLVAVVGYVGLFLVAAAVCVVGSALVRNIVSVE